MAQQEHETRAMLDGQIHDIYKVGDTIRKVKNSLEKQLDRTLTDVCIAAAGRVLKTVNSDAVYEFEDLVKGPISFESKSVGSDWVIQKRDGMPTYNFAVVVDDHSMEITHVLRGDDHISNTPKQMLVYDALGWDYPRFGHMTLIVNSETGKKLSKRDTDVLQFIEDYRELGYLPEALFNFITLLGWSPVGEDEIFSKEEFIEIFGK